MQLDAIVFIMIKTEARVRSGDIIEFIASFSSKAVVA